MATIQIEGLVEIQQALRGAAALVERESREGLERLTPVIVPNVQRQTPEDEGGLRGAVDGYLEKVDGGLALVVDAGDVPGVIVASVEGGAKPHWPPWGEGSALAEWAERHGIPPFLVARAIARRGTIRRFGGPGKGAEMFAKGLEDSRGKIDEAADEVGERVAGKLLG